MAGAAMAVDQGRRVPNGASRSASVPAGADSRVIQVESAAPVRHSLLGSGHDPDKEAAPGAQVRPPQAQEGLVVPSDALLYDSGEEAKFSTNARFEVPESGEISGERGGVSFQFEPGWSGDNQADASLVEIGDGRLLIRKNVHFLRLEMLDDDGNQIGTGISIADWEPGKAHHVTATWGDGLLSLYVDGQLAAQQHYTSHFEIPAGTPVSVGTGSQNGPVAPGSLSNIQLSKEPLSPGALPAAPTLPRN